MGEARRRKQAGSTTDPKAWHEWRRAENLLRGHASEEIQVHDSRAEGQFMRGEAYADQQERNELRAAVRAKPEGNGLPVARLRRFLVGGDDRRVRRRIRLALAKLARMEGLITQPNASAAELRAAIAAVPEVYDLRKQLVIRDEVPA